MRALLFTAGSPFARGVRILLDEIGLSWQRREELAPTAARERAEATPTLQVPTLWDGDRTLWESGVIAEYLMCEYSQRRAIDPPLAATFARPASNWNDRLIFATIQTLGTAATSISQMTWTGIRYHENSYLSRCAERLPHIMSWLESRLKSRDHGFFEAELSAQDIFLSCHLDFIANRPLGLDPRIGEFPKIGALVERTRSRATFAANPILWWEPGVVGYADDGVTPIFEPGGAR